MKAFLSTCFMQNCVLSVFGSVSDQKRADALNYCSMSGGFFVGNFIQGMTTHILSEIRNDQALEKAGSRDNSVAPFLVTFDWLQQSFFEKRLLPETDFLPPILEA